MRLRIDIGQIAAAVIALISLLGIIIGFTVGDGSSSKDAPDTPAPTVTHVPTESPSVTPTFEETTPPDTEGPTVTVTPTAEPSPEPTPSSTETPEPVKPDTTAGPVLVDAQRTDGVYVLNPMNVEPVAGQVTYAGAQLTYYVDDAKLNSNTRVEIVSTDGSRVPDSIQPDMQRSPGYFALIKVWPNAPRGNYVVNVYHLNELIATGQLHVSDGTAPAIPAGAAGPVSAWSTAPNFASAAGAYAKVNETGLPIGKKLEINTGYLTPGLAYYWEMDGTQTGKCSAGYFTTINGKPYMITAGHCGKPGAEIFIYDRGFNKVTVGRFDDKLHNYTDSGSQYVTSAHDWAFVELYDNVQVNPALGGQYDIAGVIDADKLPKEAVICHLGDTTGYQCGERDEWTTGFDDSYFPDGKTKREYLHSWTKGEQGDSGGAVFTIKDGKVYAVGVVSLGSPLQLPDGELRDIFATQEISKVMRDNGATFYGSLK